MLMEKQTFTFKTLLTKATYSDSYADSAGWHARCQPAHQEQFGVQYVAQGHLEDQQPSDNMMLALPSEQQPPND